MTPKWSVITHLPPLDAGQLQLWRIQLDGLSTTLLNTCNQILTPAEQDVAARRRAGQVREQFIIGRACLRRLLGNALNLDPQAVPIYTGPHGKPHTPQIGSRAASYNLAHSKNTILIALRRHGGVGIDLEHIDPASNPLEIATRWFTPRETASLESIVDPQARSRLFFRYWTRKEAVAKADGRGLLVSLDAFDVACDRTPSHPTAVESAGTDPTIPVPIHLLSDEDEVLYLLRDLNLGPDLAGALALESPDSTITQCIFPLELAL